MAAESSNLELTLKPFYQRASEAEERLARLEAALAGNNELFRMFFLFAIDTSKRDSGNKELLKLVEELLSKLENAKDEHFLGKQKAMKEVMQLRSENEKVQYRIIHLLQALKDADSKLALK